MAFREVDVIEVREVLRWRRWWGCGRSRSGRVWTARPRGGTWRPRRPRGCAVTRGSRRCRDELVGAVIAAVRPARPNGHGAAWDVLAARKSEITEWVDDGLSVVKIEVLLDRSGTAVPYRTLHRFASAECGFRSRAPRCGCWTATRAWNARSISLRWV